MEKMRVVEDSFKLPTESIIDHWNSLRRTSALSFHRYYVKPLEAPWAFYIFFSLLQKQSAPWNSDLSWTGPWQRLCWGLLGRSRLQSSLVNCEKCTHFWLIYALLWVWRETTSSPPHPPAENQNPVELLQCFGAGALNCFLGQITLFLVVKGISGGKKKKENREKSKT